MAKFSSFPKLFDNPYEVARAEVATELFVSLLAEAHALEKDVSSAIIADYSVAAATLLLQSLGKPHPDTIRH